MIIVAILLGVVVSVALTFLFITKIKHNSTKIFLLLATFVILIALPIIFVGTLRAAKVADDFLMEKLALLNNEAEKLLGRKAEFDATQLTAASNVLGDALSFAKSDENSLLKKFIMKIFLARATKKVELLKRGVDVTLRAEKNGKIALADLLKDIKVEAILTLARCCAVLKVVIIVAFLLCVVVVIAISKLSSKEALDEKIVFGPAAE